MTSYRIARILLLIFMVTLGMPRQGRSQEFKSPQHDARVVVGLTVPEQEITHFYDVYYGHTIRLGEFGCGDPEFLVHINEVPRLRFSEEYHPDGNFLAVIDLFTGFNAKIYQTCLGFNHPSVGGVANVTAKVGSLSNGDGIPVTVDFSTGHIMQFPGLGVSFPSTIPLPASFFNHIPITLDNPNPNQTMDFGNLTGGTWTSSGTKKDVPIMLRLAGLGSSAAGSRFMAIDAVVGTTQTEKDFSNAADARQDFESDQPTQDREDFGVGIRRSFFGEATGGSQQSGFLGALLPIRVSGEGPVKILFWTKTVKWAAVINTANAKFTKHDGQDAIQADVGSTFATVGGHKLVGKHAIRSVDGEALFDRFRVENGVLKFRVADFKVKIHFTRFLFFPIRLSSGQLEQQLNKGSVPIANLLGVTVSLPDSQYKPPCVDTHWDKMKADYGSCNDPGQRIGFLSFERGYGSGREAIGFLVDPATISGPRVVNDELEMGGKIVAVQVIKP